ncbi:MAG: hypothetical protein DHS20C16_09960 [Phycisphaerae bacterium]|nr:MAG: hypothetical protein DHS20C16_09960 [Phycisphaerae bacterium]
MFANGNGPLDVIPAQAGIQVNASHRPLDVTCPKRSIATASGKKAIDVLSCNSGFPRARE